MKQLILDSTPLAQLQSLVHEVQASCDRQLDEALESCMVFLLMRFTRKPHCTVRAMTEDYLQAFACRRSERIGRLRDVGDHCLLLSGLFPQLAEHRLMRISYYINLGQSAYTQLSGLLECGWAPVYGYLSEVFVMLVDILQVMRELDGHPVLTHIQAKEPWQDSGSGHR